MLMGLFGLAVKGLYAALIYMSVVFGLSLAFPGVLTDMAFSDLALVLTGLLLIFEFWFDFSKPPGDS